MSGYTTASRGHDAKWLLQREIEINDHLLRAGRLRKPRAGDRSAETWLACTPLTEEERNQAAERLQERASLAGLDDDATAEVLDMLGLTPAPAPAKKRASPRPRTGTCAACGRRSLRVRVDNALMAHSVYPDRPADDATCPGGAPAQTRRTR